MYVCFFSGPYRFSLGPERTSTDPKSNSTFCSLRDAQRAQHLQLCGANILSPIPRTHLEI